MQMRPNSLKPSILTFTILWASLFAWAAPFEGGFTTLSEGLELGQFKVAQATPVGDSTITVLRIDPHLWDLTIICSSATENEDSKTAKQWAQQHNLVAGINAGMFHTDFRTHTGFLKAGDHINNGTINDYQSMAVFGPRQPHLPPFRIVDLEDASIEQLRMDYSHVIQNLRLIKRPGLNRWSQQNKKWSEAALGEDKKGRILFIFCRSPYSMHDFNRILLSLPIDLVAAQHLEGGPEAQLFLVREDEELELMGSYETVFFESDANRTAWPVPNVIGITPKPK